MKTKLFFLSLFFGLTLQAQNLIKGVVSDPSGIPLPGVNIVIKDTQTGTTTDFDGKYQIQAQFGQTLVFSILGFEKKEVIVQGNTLNVSLESRTEGLSEVTLTGSRNPYRSKLNTPVPVDVVPLNELKTSMPQTNINDLLNYLVPSFNNNRQSASDGTEHIDPASLRGLGPDQVLVLINGKRRHTTSLVNNQSTFGNGSVGTDLSAIPAAAIERVEVLRDGASAQYGSDAIAGVINLILKKDTGLEVNTTYGQTSRADGETVDVNLNYGAKLGDDGGFYNLTLGFNDRQKTS
ncbi:MAG: ferric enterobactin receptor, partial [Bacteroidetes bacterium HGW-Bacteroidetes-13]